MGKRYLLDTNTIIDFCAFLLPPESHKQIAQIIDNEPVISVVNKIELLSFSSVPVEIIWLVENAIVINLDEQIVNRTILIRKTYKIKLPDAIIAATVLEYDLTLLYRNLSDFERIIHLEVHNPHIFKEFI
ncbi:type II toxin-antitoxin system VapC family toxin [Dyadobacter sp. NIV53]|uniref:type II toxin-antitoxin system VapC family toxin n=1 Tax=Dyadobacter sp. NIV53 TaxID=2861765 RepID=UPI001C86B3C2|nr:type II toxin-antitoxin system VapC family toxin [Dyadobacter sp. NIV53]